MILQSVEDFRKQIEVNLVGMFAVTRAFAPLLGADPSLTGNKGRIVNLSSVGGRMGPPFLGAYSAAKHGVEGFSESIRRELQMIGIDVIIIAPGSVTTSIWDKAEALPLDHLKGIIWEQPFKTFVNWMIENGRKGLAPEKIGEVIASALTVSKPKTRYVLAQRKFFNVTMPSLLPSRVVDHLMGKQIGLLLK